MKRVREGILARGSSIRKGPEAGRPNFLGTKNFRVVKIRLEMQKKP